MGILSCRTQPGSATLLALCLLTTVTIQVNCALAREPSAVFLLYNRFGDPRQPSVNIRLDQFEAHIDELSKSRYAVLPVPDIVAAIAEGRELPDRTVGITIDDSYASVYREAWPRLRAAGLPFTLFVTTDRVDRLAYDNMTWDQIRELHQAGVTIGNHTKSRKNLPKLAASDVHHEIQGANGRIEAELQDRPVVMAYPFGAFSPPVRDIVTDHGFTAAFGAHSGVVDQGSDRYTLSRFGMNETYADIDRFRLIVNALPLPINDVLPSSPILDKNPPAFGFMVAPRVGALDSLACFASNLGPIRLEIMDRRVEARFIQPFPAGRTRINCTMPGPNGRWRWAGRYFISE